jgi:hypothetical protein
MSRLHEYQAAVAAQRAVEEVAPTSPAPALVAASSDGAGLVQSPGVAVLTRPAPPALFLGGSPRPAAVSDGQQASKTLLYIWILLFGFVGTQLAWTLRPFFGSPDEPFQIFRSSISGTFYADIFRTIGNLFS